MASGKKSQEFEESWKANFPGLAIPRLTCFERADDGVEQQPFRKALQVTLDYHNLRITELEKKLRQQQFILEYVAKELEQLPVPRQASISKPHISNVDPKPTPMPRKPPAVPKKPKPSDSGGSSNRGVIRRNHSTPSPRQTPISEKRFQFASVCIPNSESIEEQPSPDTEIQLLPPFLDVAVGDKGSDSSSTDERFHSFEGSTFGGGRSRNNSQISQQSDFASDLPANAITNPAAGSPALIRTTATSNGETLPAIIPKVSNVSRDSMKHMDKISITDSHSSTASSSPDGESSDYMQLWNYTTPPTGVERSASSASSQVCCIA